MKKLILIILPLLFIFNLSFGQHVGDKAGKVYYDKEKTKLKEVYSYKEVHIINPSGGMEKKIKKHGPYFFYYEDGQLKISGNYKDDQKNGSWKYYDNKGKVIKLEEYQMGKLTKEDNSPSE